MPHHNFYETLGLDRTKDAPALAKEIDSRLSAGNLSAAARDELQVARKVLGDGRRRQVYDAKLGDPNAPEITVPALRELAAADFGPQPGAQQWRDVGDTVQMGESKTVEIDSDTKRTPESSTKKNKPKQYFPDTDPNAEAVSPAQGAAPGWAPGSYPTTTNIPVYQGPPTGTYTSQGPGIGQGQNPNQYGFQSHNPGQPHYSYPAQQTAPAPQQAPVEAPQPAETSTPAAAEKKGASPWLIAAIALVLAGIGVGGWWLWDNRGTEWDAADQEMADTFPQIISEKDGQRGWLGMKCTSMPIHDSEEARIRCSDKELGVSVIDYGTVANRDAQLPEGDAEVIGNNVCSARSYKMEGVTPPAYRIAPEGADAQYLLVVNGGEAESKRMYLNLCEKSRD